MADKHPYVQAPGHLVQVVTHLRNSFPQKVNADTLKRLGFAPQNESYVVNTLRFLGFINDEGEKTELGGEVFSLHQDEKFKQEFSNVVKKAYSDLFNLHGDKTWSLDADALITFFRQSDQSSGIVGQRQANTFLTLSALSGQSELPTVRAVSPKAKGEKQKTKGTKQKLNSTPAHKGPAQPPYQGPEQPDRAFGLTVRIEVNLPASGDQTTYDRIFKSIRENLLNV